MEVALGLFISFLCATGVPPSKSDAFYSIDQRKREQQCADYRVYVENHKPKAMEKITGEDVKSIIMMRAITMEY